MKTHDLVRCGALTGLAMLALFACGVGEDDQAGTEPPATTSTTAAVATSTTAAASTRSAAQTATLISVEPGDAACYLNVKDASGAEDALAADFELCPGGESDASGLAGRKVLLERRPEQIMADSCQGDPECQETKTVDLVVEVKPAG